MSSKLDQIEADINETKADIKETKGKLKNAEDINDREMILALNQTLVSQQNTLNLLLAGAGNTYIQPS